jgi:TPR repeat protein
MLKQFISGVALAVMLAGAAMAGPKEDGWNAFQRGDYETALRLTRPFANQGHTAAQNVLGWMYDTGRGVPQNYAEAAKWYRLAAEQGNADAQYRLGLMYATGEGVPQDYVLAHMWSNLAAAQGHDKNAVKNRDIIAAMMPPDQLAEAQRLAREWKPASAR